MGNGNLRNRKSDPPVPEGRDMNLIKLIASRLNPIRPWFRQITLGSIRADAFAGLTNATIVLPQGVAFAIIAGLPPQYGLFTAMVVPVVAAIWGSSMVMISGPTTAISAVIFATLAEFAIPGSENFIALAIGLTFMVGLLQLAAGLSGLGGFITFISHSVIIGFTAAAALLIAVSQLGPALGIEGGHGGTLGRLIGLWEKIGEVDANAVVIAAASLGTLMGVNAINRRVPAYIIALIAGSVASLLLQAEARGIAHFAPLGAMVPKLEIPRLTAEQFSSLLPGAAAVAFVGLLEAISIGKAFAMRRGDRYDPNQEIFGQGLSNTVGSLFQCYAGSGSFTRSGLNSESGAVSPLSAIFAAGFLLILLVIVAPLVRFVPVPAMATIIIYVAWKLVDFREIRHIVQSSRSETVVLTTTLLSGVVSELDFAILVGVLVSLSVFLQKSAHPLVAVGAPTEVNGRRAFMNAHAYGLDQCPQISFTRLEGPLYFASVEHVEQEFRRYEALDGLKTRVLNLRGVGRMDLSGVDFILGEVRRLRKEGWDMHLIAAHPQILDTLRRLNCVGVIGDDHIHAHKTGAITATVKVARDDICRTCTLRIFSECGSKQGPEASV